MFKINRLIRECPLCGFDVTNMVFEFKSSHISEFECMCEHCGTEFKMHSYDWEPDDAISKFNRRVAEVPKTFTNSHLFVGHGKRSDE